MVSLPSTDLFDRQLAEYRESVLPAGITARVAVEAGATFGWERYVGDHGTVIGLNRFGASAPYKVIFQNLGLTAEAVAAAALRTLDKSGSK